jgi:thymidylate synthase (FAD)
MTEKTSTAERVAQVEFRSYFTVDLVDSMGDDRRIVDVARVAPLTRDDLRPSDYGLLNMLMRDRHGTPWESVVLQYYIEAPIFVTREFLRHRIASYNEVSSRYKEMEPVFYEPPIDRPLRQVGKPGAYKFEAGTDEQELSTLTAHRRVAVEAWDTYRDLLEDGVAREVARNTLPVSLYSAFYVTLNLRSLFNFLSLRRVTESTSVPTFPLWEIDQVAGLMEAHAEEVVPEAMKLFNLHGRVSP